MTKNAAVNYFGYHCHSLAQICNGKEIVETVAVIGKVDCRVFCHINCLGDKISNTAASIQPNPFWFWEKFCYMFPLIGLIDFLKYFLSNICIIFVVTGWNTEGHCVKVI